MEELIKKDLKYYTDFLISKWKDEIECLKWSINRNEKYLTINKKDKLERGYISTQYSKNIY